MALYSAPALTKLQAPIVTNQAPWLIFGLEKDHACTAVFISDRFALMAGHCADEPSEPWREGRAGATSTRFIDFELLSPASDLVVLMTEIAGPAQLKIAEVPEPAANPTIADVYGRHLDNGKYVAARAEASVEVKRLKSMRLETARRAENGDSGAALVGRDAQGEKVLLGVLLKGPSPDKNIYAHVALYDKEIKETIEALRRRNP